MLELELKYLSAAGLSERKHTRQALQHAGVILAEPSTQKIIDVYYDTDAGDLHQAGWTLRVRRSGKKTKATLKQLGSAPSIFERLEVSEVISPEIADKTYLPSEVANRLVAGLLAPELVLKPLFKQVTKRRNRRITHPCFANTHIIWSEDHVKLVGDPKQDYVEHEFELCGPNSSLLAWISQHLDETENLYPALMSKFERGYHYVGPGWRELAGEDLSLPSMRAWTDLASQILEVNLLGLKHSAAFAQEGVHIEGVHQMRIWTRRNRAALRLFSDTLPRRGRRSMARHLRRLTRLSTPVRDTDVALKKLNSTTCQEAGKAEQAAVTKYRHDLVAARASAHEALRNALHSDLEAVYSLWKQLQPLNPASFDIQTGFRTQVYPQLQNILQQGKPLHKQQLAPEVLHDLRKRCRSLGYQLDIMGEVQEGKAKLKPLRKELAKLLVHMGKHQDAVVAQSQIEDQLKDAKKSKAKALKQLRKAAGRRAQKSQKRVRETWRRFELAVGCEYPMVAGENPPAGI